MTDHDLTILVATVNNLYTRYGLSGPVRLREAARGWLGIPIEGIIAAIELHMLHHRRLYAAGSGDAYFSLVQRAVGQLRDKHLHAEDVYPKPSARRGTSGAQRLVVTRLHRGAGYVEAFVDDDADVSRPDAPQPFLTREPRGSKVDYIDSLEDDIEDGAA
jgi:hypothetical protein